MFFEPISKDPAVAKVAGFFVTEKNDILAGGLFADLLQVKENGRASGLELLTIKACIGWQVKVAILVRRDNGIPVGKDFAEDCVWDESPGNAVRYLDKEMAFPVNFSTGII